MIYLFSSFCFITGLLFFAPHPLLTPLKQGLFLFSLALTCFSFILARFRALSRLQEIWKELLLKECKHMNAWIRVSMGFVLLEFLFHGYELSRSFASSFQFHDADYVGMQEVVRNLLRGNGYLSTYYSAKGEGSYLTHHFSPSLVFFLPFESFGLARWGYAIGVYFYLSLGTILWTELLLKKRTKQNGSGKIDLVYLLLFGIIANLYLYRLGTSYHFEVLVFPLSAVFFFYYEKQKLSLGLIVSLFAFLFVKEDIVIYFILFFMPSVIWNWISRFRAERNKNKEKKTFTNFTSDTGFLILLICLAYFLFVFFLLPYFIVSNPEHWFGALTKEYPESYKQVTSIPKSIQIFMELIMSSGTGFILNIPSFLGLLSIYLTHALSQRPWHHEIYSYYCYTMIPFLLYTGIVWLREKQSVSVPIFFLFLTLLFFRNLQDSNYPISLQKVGLPKQEERQAKEVTRELESIGNQKILRGSPHVFSQYNLSFFLPLDATLYPLNQVSLTVGKCASKECYLVIAPKFTKEVLVPRSFIESKREAFQKGMLIFKGEWIEVWKLRFDANNKP